MTVHLRFLARTLAVGLLMPLLFSSFSQAQDQDVTNPLNIGLPANGAFDGSDFDSVQLNNGNLHIEIPLWSMKGRALPVGYKYVYHTNAWYFTTYCHHYALS